MEPSAISTSSNTYVTNNIYNGDLSEMSPEELLKAFVEKALAADGPGAEAVNGAIGNQYGTLIAEALKDQIAERDDIPDAQKDLISDTIDAALEKNQFATTEQAMNVTEMIQDMMAEWAQEEIQDVVDSADGKEAGAEGSGGAGGSGKADGKGGADGGSSMGGGNWLVALAKAMSKIASHHLEQMIQKQDLLGQAQEANEVTKGEEKNLSNKGEDAAPGEVSANAKKLGAQARQMTELTAEIQAHAQMFKMMQETMTTVIKSVGEALNTTVRKQ